jgi:hypothetical protein
MKVLFVQLVIVIVLRSSYALSTSKYCPDYQINFEKILGYRPMAVDNSLIIMHKTHHIIPSVINLECMKMCKNDQYCDSYALNFNKSECYGFTKDERQIEYNLMSDNDLIEDINVVYFVKICLSGELQPSSQLTSMEASNHM